MPCSTGSPPRRAELPYLVHAREVAEELPRAMGLFQDYGESLRVGRYAVAFSARLPRTSGRYSAHLVSLEGCRHYFTTAGRPVRLRLISLHSWSFQQVTGDRTGFAPRMRHVAAPTRDPKTSGQGLGLRRPPDAGQAAAGEAGPGGHAAERMDQGYVPVGYHTLSGEGTFGWYRGPFTPVRAVPAPWQDEVLERPDAGLIYVREYGIYDLSYAAAWTLGRLLVLANADVSAPLTRARHAAWRTLHQAAATRTGPYAACGTSGSDDTTAEPVTGLAAMDHMMTHHLTDLLDGVGLPSVTPPDHTRSAADDQTPCRKAGRQPSMPRPRLAAAVRDAAVHPPVRRLLRRVVSRHLHTPGPDDSGTRDPDRDAQVRSAAHIDAWTLLCAVPFHYLVPDAEALPPESLRFFYIDPAWLRALVDGAVSVGVGTSLDSEITSALRDAVAANTHLLPCGLLLRSQLTVDIPNLLITATKKSDAQETESVVTFRRALGSGVELLLLADIPDQIVVAEPYHGLHFGLDEPDEGAGLYQINLRHLKGEHTGASLDHELKNVENYLRPVTAGTPDVLRLLPDGAGPSADADVADAPGAEGLIAALTSELQKHGEFDTSERPLLCPAEFALQCVNGPQQMTFRHPGDPKRDPA